MNVKPLLFCSLVTLTAVAGCFVVDKPADSAPPPAPTTAAAPTAAPTDPAPTATAAPTSTAVAPVLTAPPRSDAGATGTGGTTGQ
jgi:hypothetical protein